MCKHFILVRLILEGKIWQPGMKVPNMFAVNHTSYFVFRVLPEKTDMCLLNLSQKWNE